MDTVPEASSHVCVHVHDEITDMIGISKTAGIYFGSYPVGIQTIVRRIAQAMGIKNNTAESMLTLYADMHMDPTHNRGNGVIIDRILREWSREYHEFIRLVEISHTTQAHVFISTDKYAKLLSRFMRTPSSKIKIEAITEDIYIEAINSLA